MDQGQEDDQIKCWKNVPKKEKLIMLKSLYLMSKWIKRFENELETISQTVAHKFTCFISSEPLTLPIVGVIPELFL